MARRFLVLRHLLAPPRSLPAGIESILTVVDRVGSLQFDPLAVAGRNHDLVLHARVDGYDGAWTEELLYGRRLLFEAYNKGLSLLPTRELPWYRVTWDRHAILHGRETFVEHDAAVERVLERIRTEGPLSSLDFEREPAIDWYWGPTSKVRAILEALAEAGILGLARRDGNRRYYDLIERLLPGDLLAIRPPESEQLRHKLLSRYRGNGLLGATGSGELWSGLAATAHPDPEARPPTRAQLLAGLVERGELTPVSVEGLRGVRYIVTDELGILAQAEREVAAEEGGHVHRPGGSEPAVAFLAPLDPFVWDRDLLLRLFGFDYRWEVYTPAAKRRWGYYVLPLLFGDRLVGRIEPRIDRKSRAIRILGAWWEDGFDPLEERGFVPALAAAVEAYRAFGGATKVTWPRTRAGRALAAAVREAGPGHGPRSQAAAASHPHPDGAVGS